MVLGALKCMSNADFEKKKISNWQHCARCVYYLSEITTCTSNFKKYHTCTYTVDLQSNSAKRP